MNRIDSALYSAAQVRALDRLAIEQCAIAGGELMRRAGQACWDAIVMRTKADAAVCVVCGSGNNGGDGYVIARLARAAGRAVRLFAVGKAPPPGDAADARAAWIAAGGSIEPFAGTLPQAGVVVDALFGTGLQRRLDDEAIAAIRAMNNVRRGGALLVAVDVPSGLDASSGAASYGAVVEADLTVTFIGRKLGLHAGQGPEVAGQVQFERLAVPDAVYAGQMPLAMLQRRDELRALPHRSRSAHKGSNGHVLVIGGNEGMSGAALMAARAALRAGAGLVSVATRSAHAAVIAAAQPELMCRAVEDDEALQPLLSRADVVAIGPGLARDGWARTMWSAAIAAGKPMVVDADALNLLAETPRALDNAVLTPHPGEAGRLLATDTAAVQAERLGSLQALQQRYRACVVLKGAGSLVSGTPPRLCPCGNPGMAVGGMGDVLTGIIAALWAQGLDRQTAAQLGVLAHACAGDEAASGGERGLLPSDLIAHLRSVVNPS